ncbi:MAG: hypothetical protein J5744_01400 [Oscillospiraceae bacterium]|nr:hypothetical protein [Oscillospiraceae bacterium]
MFGYLIADRTNLEEKDFLEYRSAYCGICSSLRKNGLVRGTLSLSYDLVFLWMILSSMYEPETVTTQEKCPVHPFSGTSVTFNLFSDYVSEIGVMLSYYKALDDWNDDRDVMKLYASRLLSGAFEKAAAAFPRQAAVIKESLERISMLESTQSGDIDELCNLFGALLGETFVWSENDYWSEHLRKLGAAVGRYLFLLDAVLDLEEDIRRGRYNPLIQAGTGSPEWQRNAIDLFLGDISELYGFLPIVRYSSVLDSIIYTGMTAKYREYCAKRPLGEKADES